MTNADRSLNTGAKYPYDHDDRGDALPSIDPAHATARGILADLSDRRGIKCELDNVDYITRVELVESLAAIIRVGMS